MQRRIAPIMLSCRTDQNDTGTQENQGGKRPRTSIIGSEPMKRVDLYIKVEVELDEEEKPEKVANEICRQIEKMYVVRSAEFSNLVARE